MPGLLAIDRLLGPAFTPGTNEREPTPEPRSTGLLAAKRLSNLLFRDLFQPIDHSIAPVPFLLIANVLLHPF